MGFKERSDQSQEGSVVSKNSGVGQFLTDWRSRRKVTVFVVLFAALGIYFLINSFADTGLSIDVKTS